VALECPDIRPVQLVAIAETFRPRIEHEHFYAVQSFGRRAVRYKGDGAAGGRNIKLPRQDAE